MAKQIVDGMEKLIRSGHDDVPTQLEEMIYEHLMPTIMRGEFYIERNNEVVDAMIRFKFENGRLSRQLAEVNSRYDKLYESHVELMRENSRLTALVVDKEEKRS